jgi:GNAT superfamily N-acetyltransferase
MLDPAIEDLSFEAPGGRRLELATRTIEEGLASFNSSKRPDPSAGPLVLVVRSDSGEVIAGVRGRAAYGWLRIDMLWVSETMRGAGYGSLLLQAAERAAVDRGCHSVHLDTHEFQAPRFYLAHGYEVFGELDDYPEGDRHLYLKKRLVRSDVGANE